MRVLAVADKESAYYYDYYTPGKLSEFDLILACGDLRREYLEFLATLARCPVVYVRGNHNDSFLDSPPEGCICAEDPAACGFWGWAAPTAIRTAAICTPRGR